MFFKPKTIKFSYSEIIQMLPREIVDLGHVKASDREYLLPLNPAYIMRKVPSWKYGYKAESVDCDDFVRIFRGWLSQKGYGNILAMDTEILNKKERHNLISFLDFNRKDKHGKHLLIFGEPQTGELIPDEESRHFEDIRIRL